MSGAPQQRAQFQPSGREASVAPGTTLLAAAGWAHVSINSTCGGYGTCGDCRVRLLQGHAPITPEDRQHLTESELADGWRLACRAKLEDDVTCYVPAFAEHPRSVVDGIQRRISVEPRVRTAECDDAFAVLCGDRQLDTCSAGSTPPLYGVAFDLGTTTAAGALLDLSDGQVLAATSRVNRQTTLGADVISRAAFAHSTPNGAGELQALAVDTLNELVDALCREANVPPDSIYESVVAGNAIMLHLLLGVDPHPLAIAPFQPIFTGSQDVAAADLRLAKGAEGRHGPVARLAIHPRARLVTFPIIGAYAGGDTVAGLHATDIVRGDRPRLLIDIGTNTEVALGWNGRVVVASAPAGPAFEGGGVRCGRPAINGAVARLRIRPDLEMEVIGGGAPFGICGSGLVDALAVLRGAGLLDRSGRLATPGDADRHPLAHRLDKVDDAAAFRLTDDLCIGQRDIRELQSAIAAVAAATQIVMKHEGVAAADLADVFLAGSFGAALDPAGARTVGLVPPVPDGIVRGIGNAAIEGAKTALISFRERQVAFQIPAHTEYIELSAHPDFNDTFLAAMTFPKLAGPS